MTTRSLSTTSIFTISKPTVGPPGPPSNPLPLNSQIQIYYTIKNISDTNANAKVIVSIYEANDPSNIVDQISRNIDLASGASQNCEEYTIAKGQNGLKSIKVAVVANGQNLAIPAINNYAFYVGEIQNPITLSTHSFLIGRPSTNPVTSESQPILLGSPIIISIPITLLATQTQYVTALISIYENSITNPGVGPNFPTISSFSQSLTLYPGRVQTLQATITVEGIAGPKGIRVTLTQNGNLVADKSFEDVFWATSPEDVELKYISGRLSESERQSLSQTAANFWDHGNFTIYPPNANDPSYLSKIFSWGIVWQDGNERDELRTDSTSPIFVRSTTRPDGKVSLIGRLAIYANLKSGTRATFNLGPRTMMNNHAYTYDAVSKQLIDLG